MNADEAHQQECERREMEETTLDKSHGIGQLATAMAKAQGQITGALKDSTNPFFKSKYADLAACWDACRGPLSENGLAVIQSTEGSHTVITMLVHESGEWIRGSLTVKPGKDDAQGLGSALTYARRYALAAMVGLAQVDDDANAASAPNTRQVEMPEKQAKEIADLLDAANPDTGEGVDAFAEAWIEIGQEQQKAFGRWMGTLWPNAVSAKKKYMHDVMNKYRSTDKGISA